MTIWKLPLSWTNLLASKNPKIKIQIMFQNLGSQKKSKSNLTPIKIKLRKIVFQLRFIHHSKTIITKTMKWIEYFVMKIIKKMSLILCFWPNKIRKFRVSVRVVWGVKLQETSQDLIQKGFRTKNFKIWKIHTLKTCIFWKINNSSIQV